MERLKELLFTLTRPKQKQAADKADYIFYKIVDTFDDEIFLLQCINTQSTFRSKITDIVFDRYILLGLHPIQACYVGIEYSKFLKKLPDHLKKHKKFTVNSDSYPISRYGSYSIHFQNRKGDISFFNKMTSKETIMDPRDIALSEELIIEFDASESFYIGMLAGLKLHNPIAQEKKSTSYLKIIK